MKKCPYCAEEIQDEAIVCRFCGREIVPAATPLKAEIPTEEPKKKSNLLTCAVVLVILGLLIYFVIMSGGSSNSGSTYTRPSSSSSYQVIYEVTGTTKGVSVTYNNAQDGTEQGEYQVPFKKTYTMKPGSFAYISAQNYYDTGSVTCTIYVDGKEFKTSTSVGAYVIATCSGSIER